MKNQTFNSVSLEKDDNFIWIMIYIYDCHKWINSQSLEDAYAKYTVYHTPIYRYTLKNTVWNNTVCLLLEFYLCRPEVRHWRYDIHISNMSSYCVIWEKYMYFQFFSTTPNDCSFFISIMFILNLLTIFKAISDPFKTTIKPFSFRHAHRLFLSFWQRHSWPQQIMDWWLDSLLDQSLKMLNQFQNLVVLGTGHAVA